jgi:hypothetical protein
MFWFPQTFREYLTWFWHMAHKPQPIERYQDDAYLVKQAVRAAGFGELQRAPRWSHVGRIFGLGSTFSWRLCERVGEDPDELVGGCGVCGYSMSIVDGETVCACDEVDDDERYCSRM